MTTSTVVRTREEIEECLARAQNSFAANRWPAISPGMLFEEGVIDTINWLLYEDQDHPMEE